jgi:hypothetical protein
MTSAGKAIFWGGFWCGVIDITSALTSWGAVGVTPKRIGQGIAAGWLGRSAFQGGWPVVFLGFASHFMIAYGATVAYFLVSRTWRFLTEHPLISAVIYGEIVFLVMNMVVLPLSAIHRNPLQWTSFSPWPALVSGPVGHPFTVGLPIALAVRKYAPIRRAQPANSTAT